MLQTVQSLHSNEISTLSAPEANYKIIKLMSGEFIGVLLKQINKVIMETYFS